MSAFDVKVYKLHAPDGTEVYVCTDGMLERLRHADSEVAQTMLHRYEELLPHCEVETYHLRSYTFGERLEAEAQCTDWSTGEPRIDNSKLTFTLLAKALDASEEEVKGFHPQLGQFLWMELQHRCTPNPFAWSISSSRQPNSEMESPQRDAPKSSSSSAGSARRSRST